MRQAKAGMEGSLYTLDPRDGWSQIGRPDELPK